MALVARAVVSRDLDRLDQRWGATIASVARAVVSRDLDRLDQRWGATIASVELVETP
jgi:hypothetical protein